MGANRQIHVGRLIQRVLSNLFLERGKAIYGDVMVSISEVKMNSDLSIANVYLSIYNVVNEEDILSRINEENKDLRRRMAQTIKSEVRIIPELRFFIDETISNMEKTEELFKKLKDK